MAAGGAGGNPPASCEAGVIAENVGVKFNRRFARLGDRLYFGVLEGPLMGLASWRPGEEARSCETGFAPDTVVGATGTIYVSLSVSVQRIDVTEDGVCFPPVTVSGLDQGVPATQMVADDHTLYWFDGTSSATLFGCEGACTGASAGSRRFLASAQQEPRGLLLNADKLYWATGLGDVVWISPASPASPVALLSGLDRVENLLVDGGFLYVAETSDGGTIRRCELSPDGQSCSGLRRIDNNLMPVTRPLFFTATGDRLYWTDDGERTVSSCAGGDCITSGGVRVDAETEGQPGDVAVIDDCVVFFDGFGRGAIRKVPSSPL